MKCRRLLVEPDRVRIFRTVVCLGRFCRADLIAKLLDFFRRKSPKGRCEDTHIFPVVMRNVYTGLPSFTPVAVRVTNVLLWVRDAIERPGEFLYKFAPLVLKNGLSKQPRKKAQSQWFSQMLSTGSHSKEMFMMECGFPDVFTPHGCAIDEPSPSVTCARNRGERFGIQEGLDCRYQIGGYK